MKTAGEIRTLFEVNGKSVAEWARSNGFSPALVYRVLRGESPAKRGQTHQIAVRLGLRKTPSPEEKLPGSPQEGTAM